MYKQALDLKDYVLNPSMGVEECRDIKIKLFGKDYYVNSDPWRRHIHLKITDNCNAKCDFCIEKDSNTKNDKFNFLLNTELLLEQLQAQNVLNTISITGGEPTVSPYFNDALNILSKYSAFITVNTNGRNIVKYDNPPEWFNISKHDFDDSDIFQLPNLTIADLRKIKILNESKIRLQTVLLPNHLDSVDKILKFIYCYQDHVDDFSFRQLMNTANTEQTEVSLIPFRKWLVENANFHEQTIQEYYVYEIWDIDGVMVTLSFSDMDLLLTEEAKEDDSLLREIIVNPDGAICGSWSNDRKIIN
jgi:organic radical activating enzyme